MRSSRVGSTGGRFSSPWSRAARSSPTQPPCPPSIDTPIFRSTVDAVELDAFVVDADGNPGHRPDGRRLRDSRRRQAPAEITLVRGGQHPHRARSKAAYAQSARSCRMSARISARKDAFISSPSTRCQRAWSHGFGCASASSSSSTSAKTTRAAIVYVGRGRSTDGQDFTSDRAALLRSIDRLSGGFGAGDLENAAGQAPPPGSAAAADARSASKSAQAGRGRSGGGGASGEPDRRRQQRQIEPEQRCRTACSTGEAEFLLRQRMLSLRSLIGIHGRHAAADGSRSST